MGKVLAKGDTKASILLNNGIQADLRVVPEDQYGFALCYFTGSKDHSIKMRQLARKHGWSLSEWDMISENPKCPAPFEKCKKPVKESDIYEVLGFAFIPPELRENTGEFEAASKSKIPLLVEEKDLRGAFHCHTTASDGRNTLDEMVSAADSLGWEYIGISDHSKSSIQANGLSEERVLQQVEQIRKLNASGEIPHTYLCGHRM